ncbi:glycosyltransferase family 2 protein [Agathobaculum sp. LCP25S3_E8]|uniref:glycosyltransferase family 2 protein n=1 Tax=Agathobaculum sp. LCP25S3_E8 TaxID=3438735 RepID=UPI003F92E4D4
MKTNLLFAIIIPVYQVEDYLSECLDSVLPLTDSDCEIILVVGNSTDRSNEIAMEYAQRNAAVRLVIQNGAGLSNARNCGVENSTGTFIIYLDSDDVVDTENLSMLMEYIRQHPDETDVYMSDYIQLFSTGVKRVVNQVGNTPHDAGLSALPTVLREKKCFWNVWRYIYRRRFLEENCISFLENRTSEDIDYTTRVFASNPQIEFWNKPYYFYRMGRVASLMNVVSAKRVQDVTFVIENSILILDQSETIAFADLLKEQYRFEYLLNIALIREVDKRDRKAAYNAFSDWKSVLYPSRYPITNAFYIFMKFFGLSAGAYILSLLKKAKRKLVRR